MKHHALSAIHPKATIGDNVTIEAFVNIEEDVIVGSNCWIGSGVTLMRGTRIGNNCKIFPGAVLGAVPQDLKFGGEYTFLEVGNNVTIREYCTLNRGTSANQKTAIGDNSLIMAYVHVAHDCIIGKNCILANNAGLAGHIEVEDYAIIGGMVAVHQFVKIGKHAMVGGGSLVRKDVPPYVKAARTPLSYAGVNSIGLRRRGFDTDTIHHIQDIFRILFVRGYGTKTAISILESEMKPTEYRDEILQFIRDSRRGIMKGFRHLNGNKTR